MVRSAESAARADISCDIRYRPTYSAHISILPENGSTMCCKYHFEWKLVGNIGLPPVISALRVRIFYTTRIIGMSGSYVILACAAKIWVFAAHALGDVMGPRFQHDARNIGHFGVATSSAGYSVNISANNTSICVRSPQYPSH